MNLISKDIVDARLGRVYANAVDSDYYSRDGVTWDKTADALEYIHTSHYFKFSIGESLRAVDPLGYSLKGLPHETLQWVDRIEKRMEASKEQNSNA